jgi:hypothetical protein
MLDSLAMPYRIWSTGVASGGYRVCGLVMALIVLGCSAMFLAQYLDQYEESLWRDVLVVGVTFGTMFSQTAVAATWAVFGPAPLIWRLPLSLIWVTLLFGAWSIENALENNGTEGAAGIMGLHLYGEWLVLQVPLWLVSIACGAQFVPINEQPRSSAQRPGQFSLLHLIVLTAIIGCGLTIGRLLVPEMQAAVVRVGEWGMYKSLALAAVVLTLPLILAALSPRWYVLATGLSLLPIALTTIWEPPFLSLVGENFLTDLHLVCINIVTAAWILLFVLVLRTNGYRLATRSRKAELSL